jgi:hypothetical protein
VSSMRARSKSAGRAAHHEQNRIWSRNFDLRILSSMTRHSSSSWSRWVRTGFAARNRTVEGCITLEPGSLARSSGSRAERISHRVRLVRGVRGRYGSDTVGR